MAYDANGNPGPLPQQVQNGWVDTGRRHVDGKHIWEYHGHDTSGGSSGQDVIMRNLPEIQEALSIRGYLVSSNPSGNPSPMRYPINFYRYDSGQNIYTYINSTVPSVSIGWRANDTFFANRPVYWTLEATRNDAP
jgi:V8-like Glu-specific endopeptidase